MSDAEQEWEAWARSRFYTDPNKPLYTNSSAVLHYCHSAYQDAYAAGVAAATADTEAKVRRAVEATLDAVLDIIEIRANQFKEGQELSPMIRALDVDAIVARVMQEVKTE